LSISAPPRPALDPRHRCISEADVIRRLAFSGWLEEISDGREIEAQEGGTRALAAAVAAGAGYAEPSPGCRLFDYVEVQEVLDWLAHTGQNPLWGERVIPAHEAFIASTRSADRPKSQVFAAEPPPTRFRVSFERTFDLSRFSVGSLVRLRLPAPLRSAYHDEVTVTPMVSPALRAQTHLSDGSVHFRLPVPSDPIVTACALFEFTGRPPRPREDAGRLTDQELAIYLRPSEGLIELTPRVRDLATHLAGQAEPPAAVAAFAAYMTNDFHPQWLRYDELSGGPPCDWALDNRRYDCRVGAALLAALCRARDIPARMVNGHFLSRLKPSNHSWVEVWIDGMGWLPIDILNQHRHQPEWCIDHHWGDHFVRRWDYRLVFERPPLAFTGRMSVAFPAAWQMMHLPTKGGMDIIFTNIGDGSLIYRERVIADWTT